MHDQELLRRAHTTKIMALPTTSTLSLLIMLHQQVRGRPTIS
jgi:hypothetical protein